MRRLLLVAALAACGGGGHASNDAAVPDVPADPPADAAPDAPASAQLTVLAKGEPITAWTFSDTATGAKAAITMFVRNDGSTAAPIALALVTSDYTIDAAGSTCDDVSSLAPGAYCHVRVTFAPSAVGAHDAMLAIGGVNAPSVLPLHGMAFGPPAGLALDMSSVDFGIAYASQSAPNATLLLVNNGTSTAALDSLAVAGAGFVLVMHNCPTSLTAGGACSITLGYQPTTPGASTGSLTATSGATQLVVGLTGYAARSFTIQLTGGGIGTVTSMPDVQCGQACLDNALGAVVLTASANTGSIFAGWQSSCGTSPTCTIGPGGSVLIRARFELMGAKAIAITSAGAAPGFVYVMNGSELLTQCTSSCTTYVPNGMAVHVFGFTPSTFSGWTGDCTTSTSDCNLGTVVNDRAATVTFVRDDREIATLIPSAPVTGMAMTPDGDLVLASASGVSRITTSGTVVWTTSIAGGAKELATDAAGNVYGRGGPGVFSLTSAGAMRWTRTIAVANNYLRSIQSTISVSPDGTVVAAHTSDGAVVLDGMGVDRFTVTGLTSDGMAVSPNGTVAIGHRSDSFPPARDVRRFDATGAALTSLVPLPGDADVSLIYDAQNALCSQTTAGGTARVSRIGTDLSTIFSNGKSTALGSSPPAGIVVASTGDVVAMRGVTEANLAPGMRLEVFSPTGTSTWTHSKPSISVPVGAPLAVDGVTPVAIAADGNHHLAIAGSYAVNMPWIQVYALP